MSKIINQLLVPDEIISDKIYLIRDKKVMIDKDLAILYGIRAVRLREQVKRNIERFPENFMFQLSENEVDIMVSQNAIPSRKYLGGYLPYAFTEHGILMLANVVKNERAIKVSIRIIEIFVRIREMFQTHNDILLKLEEIDRKFVDQDQKILMIFEYLRKFEEAKQQESDQKSRIRVGFKLPEKD